MRGELELVYRMTLEDAAVVQAALEALERLSAAKGALLPREVAVVKLELAEFVSRAAGRAEMTTRPMADFGTHAEERMNSEEAARVLGLTVSAVTKRCRTGVFAGVARRERGRWWIPTADVLAVKESVG